VTEGVKRLRPRMMPVAYRVLGSGEPGLESRSGDGIAPVLSLRVEGDVWSVYITANPDKLARWSAAEVESHKGNQPRRSS
jgi:hypothetical protein